ncbi:MAG: hypothetical protein CMP52_05300 [Flavobacteriales bacterium]|nr:hypothetical protein [Candidatus Arcticimaribacter sp.]|tara:strand:+ start:1122 stop:1382 length:261 start_codon:yes stop_codon:yes gene_type:complete
MNISVEITLLPLQNEYETLIKEFIKVLRLSEFKVLENPLSTQIYGPYLPLMNFLVSSIEECFGNIESGVVNLKIVKSDRSDYIPNF